MIQLPPGCRLNYSIWIDVDAITDEMCEWFSMIGGTVAEVPGPGYGAVRVSDLVKRKTVQYGKAKPSYYRQDGTGYVKINFNGDDASTASVFLLKFMDNVKAHNVKQEFDLIK